MKMLFLVDGDNNIGTGLTGLNLLSETDTVLIFHSRGMQLTKLKARAAQSQADVQFIESVKDGKNSVDFQIIAELGVRIGRGEVEFAYVISQDQGYVAPIESLKLHYSDYFREIRLARSIEDCLHLIFILRAATRAGLSAALASEYGSAHGDLIYRHLAGLFGAEVHDESPVAAEPVQAAGGVSPAAPLPEASSEKPQGLRHAGQRTSGFRRGRRGAGSDAAPSVSLPSAPTGIGSASEQTLPSASPQTPEEEQTAAPVSTASDRHENVLRSARSSGHSPVSAEDTAIRAEASSFRSTADMDSKADSPAAKPSAASKTEQGTVRAADKTGEAVPLAGTEQKSISDGGVTHEQNSVEAGETAIRNAAGSGVGAVRSAAQPSAKGSEAEVHADTAENAEKAVNQPASAESETAPGKASAAPAQKQPAAEVSGKSTEEAGQAAAKSDATETQNEAPAPKSEKTVIYPFRRAPENRYSSQTRPVVVAEAPVIPGAAESHYSKKKSVQANSDNRKESGAETNQAAAGTAPEPAQKTESIPADHARTPHPDDATKQPQAPSDAGDTKPAVSQTRSAKAPAETAARKQNKKDAAQPSAKPSPASEKASAQPDPLPLKEAASTDGGAKSAGAAGRKSAAAKGADKKERTPGKRPVGRPPKSSSAPVPEEQNAGASGNGPEQAQTAAGKQGQPAKAQNPVPSGGKNQDTQPKASPAVPHSVPQKSEQQDTVPARKPSRKNSRQNKSSAPDSGTAAEAPSANQSRQSPRRENDPGTDKAGVKNHNMKLFPEQFEKIKAGTKQIEIRCNDAKRQKIRPGDTITLVKQSEDGETMVVYVTGMYPAPSFRELFEQFDPAVFGCAGQSVDEMLNGIYKIFDKRKEKKYGAVGIGVSLKPDGSAPVRQPGK